MSENKYLRRSQRVQERAAKTLAVEENASQVKSCPVLRNPHSTKMEGSKASSKAASNQTRYSEKRRQQAELEYSMKKKELEQEELKKRQEMLDLEFALKLSRIEDDELEKENSERNDGSVESVSVSSPSIEKWIRGCHPWKNVNERQTGNSEVENKDKVRITPSFTMNSNAPENYYQLPNSHFAKLLARQSMPKDLPFFSGNPMEWPNFIYQFRNSTKVCGYSQEENHCRLQKCLKGIALKIVQSLLIMPKNVDKILSILENRFGQPQQIIFMLLEKVKNFPTVKEDKLDLLIDFSEEVKNLVGTIESLDAQDHLQNPILLQELLNKLPNSYKMMWAEFISNKKTLNFKLIEFNLWLDQKSMTACQVQMPKFHDTTYSDRNLNTGRYVGKKNTTLTTIDKKNCICCKNELHHLSTCPTFISFSDDKRWDFITSNKMCFSCLIPFHTISNCRKKQSCGINNCRKPHHRLLHKSKTELTNRVDEEVIRLDESNKVEMNCHISTNTHVLLKILPVVISYNTKNIKTYALLDDASTVTLIDQDLADSLNLQGPQHPLCIQWTNNQVEEQEDSRLVSFTIKSEGGNQEFQVRHARTMRGLSLPSQTVDSEVITKQYPYLNNKFVSMNNAHPKILIGQDNWPLLVNRRIVTGPWNGPALSKTLLGWVLHGNIDSRFKNNSSSNLRFICHVSHQQNDDLDLLHELVKDQWKIDMSGTENSKISMSKEDRRSQAILDKTMKRIGDRWETGLLWRNEEAVLPESKNMALTRLYSTERKMDKNPVYGKEYCDKINDLQTKGYIRKLSEEEINEPSPKIWYLPDFGIMNPNKPKLRIVFDASAKSQNYSLNDFLMTGPDLYNSLHKILLNFRIKRFAFTGDVKEMFLQVKVRKEDCAAQRFLWREMDRSREPSVYQIEVVFFGSSSGPCLAQEAKNRNAREFEKDYPEAARAIIEHHYMDDYLGNAYSVEEGKQLINDVIFVHLKGGFSICNWVANFPEIIKDIDPSLLAHEQKTIDINSDNNTERILGVYWNSFDDTFTFKTKFNKINNDIFDNIRRPTKREILKVVMSIFDPLGFLSHFIIQGKILLQDIWRCKLGWDDEITENLNEKWQLWLSDLKTIFIFKIPRMYFTLDRNGSDIQLHLFCDASERAYTTVAYLRCQDDREVQVSFVKAKSRVTPLKPVSIPRLELQAALMGARLGQFLKSNLELNIKNIFYWTDSKTVLQWICSEAQRYAVFVAQRIGEIQTISNVSDWRHISSHENVADEATKRYRHLEFSKNSRWLFGPEFLYLPPEKWPKEKSSEIATEEQLLEEKRDYIFSNFEKLIIPIPSIEYFSKWTKLLRSTGWMLRFIEKCKTKNQSQKFDISKNTSKKDRLTSLFSMINELTKDEILEAETLLYKKVQSHSFPEELYHLRKNFTVPKNSRLFNLSCFLDTNGIIRLNGRLDNLVQDSDNLKNPIILDPNHQIVKLLMRFYHDEAQHHGHETVISNLRQKYWILRMRQAMKGILAKCQICKNRKSTPKIPIMGQLPSCRLERTIRPFIKTGVDYFGPLLVTVKRSHEKRYGVIFTCMITRAVHLEIAHDLSTDGFIHALRQFGCRRGFPEKLYSDNGTNFTSANRELRECLEEMNQSEIKSFCTLKHITWKFNPPLSPNMGGVWERLIQIVKKTLREILKEKYPHVYVLRTMFCEIEDIINSRPLTHVSIDPDDPEPLTPNHFLIGPSYAAVPCTSSLQEGNINLLSKWKAAQKLADMFGTGGFMNIYLS